LLSPLQAQNPWWTVTPSLSHHGRNTVTGHCNPPSSLTTTTHRKPLTKPHTSHPNEFHPSDYFFFSVKTTTTATTTPKSKLLAKTKSQNSQQPTANPNHKSHSNPWLKPNQKTHYQTNHNLTKS